MPLITIRKTTADLFRDLDALLAPFAEGLCIRGKTVLIKPNLVEPEPWTTGQTTNPALVEAIVQWCRLQGAASIAIGEGPSYFQPASSLRDCFIKTGIADVARRQKIEWILFDEHPYRVFKNHSPLMPDLFAVSEHAFGWDRIINVPVPKTHYLTKVSIAMKNLKGFIKRDHKPLFHHSGTHGIHGAVTGLNMLVRPALHIVDGTASVLRNKNFLLAGTDIVAVDALTASFMGCNPEDIPIIRLAHEAGLGESDLTAIEIRGDDIKELSLNLEQPLQFLQRAFPDLTLRAETACSGCLIPLFAALRRLADAGVALARPCTIAAGPQKSAMSADAAIGRCAQPVSPGQPWLRACPPDKNELYAFLKAFFTAS